MTKKEFLGELENAKTSHIKWHAYAQNLVEGIETGTEQLPQLYTDCTFGKWYYREGHYLSFIEEFKEIANIHENVHNLYIEIYNKFLSPEKKGIFISSAKAKKLKKKEMINLANKLKQTSDMMVEKLQSIQKVVDSMSDGEIKYRINKIY